MKLQKQKIKKDSRQKPQFVFSLGVPVYSLKPKVIKPLFRLGVYHPFSPFAHLKTN